MSSIIYLRDEFARTKARVTTLEAQSTDKDTQIRKLQTVKQRLESLCRFQQEKLKEHADQRACTESEAPCAEPIGGDEHAEERDESTSTCFATPGPASTVGEFIDPAEADASTVASR
jgi:hypothetical protein